MRVSLPKVIALVAVSVLATAATMLGLQSWRTGSPEAMSPPLVRFPIVLPPDQPLNRPGFHDLAVSPDGSKIVYSAGRQLYLRRIGEMEAQPIQGTASSTFGPVSPTFSPNGEWVAFAPDSNLGIAKVNVAGGAPLQLTKEGQTASLSWEGDDILFDQVGTGIQRIPAKGGAVETLVPVRLPETAFAPHRVGNIVIFTVTDATGINRWDHANVVAYRLDTKERSVLVTGASDARYLPTGHLVYAQAGLLMAAPFDIDRLSVTGAAKPVVEGVARSDQPEGSRGGAARYSIGSNGVLAYVPGPTRGVVSPNMVALVDLTGGVRLLDFPPGYYTHPRVSPDGKRLAVSSITGGAIWIYDLDSRQPPRPLTFGSLDRFPIWTPDSQDVTFQSNREGDVAVWRQRADGSARAVRVTSAEGAESHEPESWSPDGKVLTVYFGGQGIWTTTGGNARLMRLIDAVGIEKHSSFSPDGHLLAYAMIASGVFVEPFPLSGAKYQVGPAGTRTPAWSRDGKHLFMHRAATNEILVSDVEPGAVPRFGAPRPLPIKGTIHPQNQRNFDVMPDGQHLVVILPADNTAPGTVTAAQQINVVVNWFEELKRLVPVK